MPRGWLVLLLLPGILVLSPACDLDDDDDTPLLLGTLYNSNDGSCSTSGEDLDFYFNGILAATVESGESSEVFQAKGTYVVEVRLTRTDSPITDYELLLDGAGWWAWAGCSDGSHP